MLYVVDYLLDKEFPADTDHERDRKACVWNLAEFYRELEKRGIQRIEVRGLRPHSCEHLHPAFSRPSAPCRAVGLSRIQVLPEASFIYSSY